MSIKEPSFMTEIEDHEMNEAAMSLVMFSKQVYDFDLTHGDDDDSMDLDQLKDCVESMLDFREMVSNSGFEKSSNCSDVVALRSKLQSNSSHRCKICGKSFECYQALGGHQRLHRPIKGKLSRKREYYTDDNSLFDSSEPSRVEEKILDCVELKQDFGELLPLNSKLQKRPESSSSYKCNICGKSFGCFQALGGHKRLHRSIKGELARTEDDNSLSHSSEAKKIVSEPSKFEVSQEEKILHCVESKQDFSELLSHLGFDKSSSCSDVGTLRGNSSRRCNICGKSFECYQALGGHQRLHRPIKGKLARKREKAKDDNSLFESLEAKKIVSEPLRVEEKILDCVELKKDFCELLLLNSKLQKRPESGSSYKCKICGKSFGCFQALGGHKRLHRSIKGELARTEDDNSLSHSSEAKKIVSEPSKFEVSQEKFLHCVESKQDFSELLSHSGVDKFSSSTLVSKLQKETQSKSGCDCKICEKSFVCSQGLASHKRLLHRPIRGNLARKGKYTEDYTSLCYSLEASKIVSQPSSFEASQEKILHCVESKQDFSELLSYSDFDKSSSCSALPSTLKSKLQKKTQSKSSCDCNICGKSFECYQALGGHQRLHRPIKGKRARKRKYTEDDNTLIDSSEAKKIVLQPSSSFEVSQEKILHCVESKQDFSKLLSHSGFDESSSYSALPFTLRSKLQEETQSKSSCDCKICVKSFVCSQALGSHKRLHRPSRRKLARKREDAKDYSLFDSSEAKKIVSQPSSFEEVSQEKILHCVESKQDFSALLSYSGFEKSSDCSNTSFIPLPSSLKSKSHSNISITEQYTPKMEKTEDGNSLFGITDSEASNIVSQPSRFEVFHDEKILHCV